MRIDKYIWAVRIYKTRSIASKECHADNVKLKGVFVKASKEVALNDIIEVKVNPIWKKYMVIDLPKSRVGAKLTSLYIKDITEDSLNKELEHFLEVQRQMRLQGFKGRPTKRDRRKLDGFQS